MGPAWTLYLIQGAGLISISSLETTFLYKQGKISPNDIIGKGRFIDLQVPYQNVPSL